MAACRMVKISTALPTSIFFVFIHERQRERDAQRHRQREREKQAPCREPDVGLDPGSPGSHPGLQAVLNPCATRAAHLLPIFKLSCLFVCFGVELYNTALYIFFPYRTCSSFVNLTLHI